MSYLITSSNAFRPTSTALPLPVPTTSDLLHLSSFYLVHHGGHSYLILDNHISNFIAPCMSTHPSQHPHFWNVVFWNGSSSLASIVPCITMSAVCLLQLKDIGKRRALFRYSCGIEMWGECFLLYVNGWQKGAQFFYNYYSNCHYVLYIHKLLVNYFNSRWLFRYLH